MILDSKIPGGSIEEKWTKHKFELKLVNPANKRKFTVIVVGTGLAGASAAASLGELGYNVKSFCIQDSPRRAHSIAAQGGINAAKNYKNDGDSRAVHTPLQPRAVSTLLRTTKTMATPFIVCSTIPLRVVTSALAKPTCTAWPKTRTSSSTSASLKAFRSVVNTVVFWTTALSVVRRFPVRSTLVARRVSSSCSVLTRLSCARLPPVRSRCSRVAK